MALPRLRQSPTDPDFVQDPYRFYAHARALGALFFWEDYGLACTTTYEAARTILRDRRFGRAPLAAAVDSGHLSAFQRIEKFSLLELEPPDHTRLRRLVLQAFTTKRVAALAPWIEARAHALIDMFPDGAFDLLPSFATPLPVAVITKLLGVPGTMAPDLLRWSNAMVAMYQARRDPTIESAANAAAAEFSTYLKTLIDDRRSKPGDDLLTTLIAAAQADGGRLHHDELISIIILLLNAGHEATVHTIGNAVRVLIESKAAMSAFAEDQIQKTVEEVMRFDPPLHIFRRTAYERVTLFGHVFHRGDEVACLLGAAGRDPALLDLPEKFDPARPTPNHLALGAGIHFCVGAPLARLELQIALRILFTRCPSLRIVEAPQFADLYHFHGLKSLMVRR